jgi:glycosyltransferase involved in cell wall biosynthesis
VKILLAHNRYKEMGGEDVVVANEHALLMEQGNEVRLWCVTNDGVDSAWSKAKTALQATYSKDMQEGVRAEIATFAPDVVHVHNFFPLLTPSIYDACLDAGVPVVQTLHNYRTICAGGLLLRGGKPCEDCIGASPYLGAIHGCYRGSRLGSLAVARMIDVHRKSGTWQSKVGRFIAPTAFAKNKFVEGGFPADRIAVKPNFVEDLRVDLDGRLNLDAGNRHGGLFVGRLSTEKGLHTLLEAWKTLNVDLRIVGDGPISDFVRAAATSNVTSLGRLSSNAVAVEMGRAAFLVMPSEWYETFGMTIVEAFCQGLPVIASRLGAMAEIVEDGTTGLHFTPGDASDLAAKVRWAAEHPEEMSRMGSNARHIYQEKYTPEQNYKMLAEIYEAAIADADRRHI